MNAIKITTATATDIGASRTNQDRAYTANLGLDPHTTCAVFDGHGTYGEEVAMWCVEFLAGAEEKPLDSALFSALNEDIRERLRAHVAAKSLTGLNVYERQEGLYNAGSNTPIRGGTTASILRIDHMTGAITCASVGDSDVRVYDLDTDDEGISLMADHTPTNPAEYERVLAFCAAHNRGTPHFNFDTHGGRLSAERRPVFVKNAETGAWELNPMGGFFHCDIRCSWGAYFHSPTLDEGLAMTRSIGDFHMARFGLSHEPHVVTSPPPAAPGRRAVICASDGFWDFVTYSEVRGALRDCADAAEATAALMELAKERTRAALEDSLGDNITITVAFVTVTPPELDTGRIPVRWHGQVYQVDPTGAAPPLREDGSAALPAQLGGSDPSLREGETEFTFRRITHRGKEMWARDCRAAPPPELDTAFLLGGSPFRRESLFAEPEDDPIWDTAVNVMDVSFALPAEIMARLSPSTVAALSAPPAAAALPGSTEDILRHIDPVDPVARWTRAGSPAEREAVLATLAADHPLHCDLHRDQFLPGLRIRRSRNTARSYGMYAPSCSGCRIGAEEEADDAAADAEIKACTEWLNLRINDLAEASIAGASAAALADRRAEVEGGIFRLEACDAWASFGNPTVMRSATIALAADDAVADIRRAMSIIAEATGILRTATVRLRATPLGAGYAAYKTAMAFLEANPPA